MNRRAFLKSLLVSLVLSRLPFGMPQEKITTRYSLRDYMEAVRATGPVFYEAFHEDPSRDQELVQSMRKMLHHFETHVSEHGDEWAVILPVDVYQEVFADWPKVTKT